MPQLCPIIDDKKKPPNPMDMFCIPDGAQCPITKVDFDSTDGSLKVSRDPSDGLPIIQLFLTEGAPCICIKDGKYE